MSADVLTRLTRALPDRPFARHVTPHAMITAHMAEVPSVLRPVDSAFRAELNAVYGATPVVTTGKR